MIWADREAKKLKERNKPLEWVDDMKTPSGRVHVGALRGVIIHDIMYKALLNHGVNARYTYVFDDQDPMDGLPSYLPQEQWEQYMGWPLYKIPSPEPGFRSFAHYYAQEFIDVFNSINAYPEIVWGSELYTSGKMNTAIKTVLDNAEKVREIYARIAHAEKSKDWYAFSVECDQCHKIGTTQVYDWDGENVHYRCKPDAVKWAKGCGHEGKKSPYNGNGKLLWKLDWPAMWSVIGVTIEGSGKDHMSSGGSYDMADAFCKEVFHMETPYAFPYEWFTIGGRKMSSSKGIGSSAKEVSQILPPEVFRFLIVRTPIGTALDFNPYGETIPRLFDDYDRCMEAYFTKLENKLPEGKPGEVLADFARIIELSEVRPLPISRQFLPRFRTICNLMKSKTDLVSYFCKQKGSQLTEEEKSILEERTVFAEVYLSKYAEGEQASNMGHRTVSKEQETEQKAFAPTTEQKAFLQSLIAKLGPINPTDRDAIQNTVFEVLKASGQKPRDVFPAFYQALIGQNAGPRAADIIIQEGLDKSIEKLKKLI
ncbi:lysine--tRNA ligase [Candidatus Roizmanbacteria bacterium]|nr:lysine--tRNA ligase [Candidatus Roizmanbacteria bacterium]